MNNVPQYVSSYFTPFSAARHTHTLASLSRREQNKEQEVVYVYEYFSGSIANDKHLADSLLPSCFPFIQPQKPRPSHLSAIYPDRFRRSSDKSSSETERARGHRISLAQSVLKKINPRDGLGLGVEWSGRDTREARGEGGWEIPI